MRDDRGIHLNVVLNFISGVFLPTVALHSSVYDMRLSHLN